MAGVGNAQSGGRIVFRHAEDGIATHAGPAVIKAHVRTWLERKRVKLRDHKPPCPGVRLRRQFEVAEVVGNVSDLLGRKRAGGGTDPAQRVELVRRHPAKRARVELAATEVEHAAAGILLRHEFANDTVIRCALRTEARHEANVAPRLLDEHQT